MTHENFLLVETFFVSTDTPSRQVHLHLKISGHLSKIYLRELYMLNIFFD